MRGGRGGRKKERKRRERRRVINGNIMWRKRAHSRVQQTGNDNYAHFPCTTEPNCITMDEIDFQSGSATPGGENPSRIENAEKHSVLSGRIWTRSLMFPEIRYFRRIWDSLNEFPPDSYIQPIFQWISPLIISTGKRKLDNKTRFPDFLNPYTIAFRPAQLFASLCLAFVKFRKIQAGLIRRETLAAPR